MSLVMMSWLEVARRIIGNAKSSPTSKRKEE
jgi:hypothetical protein